MFWYGRVPILNPLKMSEAFIKSCFELVATISVFNERRREMAKNRRHKQITNEILIQDHTSFFYPVSRLFKPGALRAFGIVTIVGQECAVPL